MFKVAICDDESVYAKHLEKILSNYSNSLLQIQLYTSGSILLQNLTNNFDICFLDIEMPEINGIEIAKRIKSYNPQTYIVFTTLYSEYAVESYNVKGYAYILKPYKNEQIEQVLDELIELIGQEKSLIKTKDGMKKLTNQEIEYINIEGRNICYHLRDGSMLFGPALRGMFRDAVAQFFNKPDFFFLQPSLIVNLENIEEMNREHIIFDNGEIYYLPKHGYDKIMQVWSYYKVKG